MSFGSLGCNLMFMSESTGVSQMNGPFRRGGLCSHEFFVKEIRGALKIREHTGS